jgi:hypothetical protein
MQLTASEKYINLSSSRSAVASAEMLLQQRATARAEDAPLKCSLAAAAAAQLVDHYGATREIQTKSAGFYQFSGNGEERQAQMDALAKEREETERKRKARDEVGDAVKRKRESEGEERKRKIEAKRREMEEKRKRLKSGSVGGDRGATGP